MAIETISQTIKASLIGATVVTPVVADADTGRYVREFRFFDEDTNLILTVRVDATSTAAISVTTPQLQV